MADLGAIGIARESVEKQTIASWWGAVSPRVTDVNRVQPFPYWSATIPLHLIPRNGALSGVVQDTAVPKAGVMVRLYYRASGILIDQRWTASDGSYQFTGLDTTDAEAYQVVVIDTAKNALALDRLTAV